MKMAAKKEMNATPTAMESANRADGGFCVKGQSLLRNSIPTREGGAFDRNTIAIFSGLYLEADRTALWDIANFLNDRAGLPHARPPQKLREVIT